MPRPRRVATEAEKALWSNIVRDVRPLGAQTAWEPPAAPEPALPSPPAGIAPPAPAAEVRQRKPGPVDRATLARLADGRIAIEARIDLHGMDQRAAFAALMGFIDVSARNGRRALLVITGKGPSAGGGGVLRRNAPHWLMASPFAQRILAVTPAHVRHGGDGAFYVMLRRKR
jgi:DNA-nicking Smr family endonuclease